MVCNCDTRSTVLHSRCCTVPSSAAPCCVVSHGVPLGQAPGPTLGDTLGVIHAQDVRQIVGHAMSVP
jgi:hypothetical protein